MGANTGPKSADELRAMIDDIIQYTMSASHMLENIQDNSGDSISFRPGR